MKMNKDQQVYIYSMGKKLKITAIFHDDKACNNWLERNPNHGVIACAEPYIFVAHLYDHGAL